MKRIRAALVASGFLFLTHTAFGADEVESNPNLHPVGQMAAGALTLRLEVRDAMWNPEGEGGPQIPVQVFAEEGRPAMNPGPLIRVVAGTRVHISLRNRLASQNVTIHGLNAHAGGDTTPLTVPPLGTSDVEFQAVRPGVYFYWGTTTGATLDKRNGADSQLSGALVVDPASRKDPDRIFVLGHWLVPGDPKAVPPIPDRETWVINGRSWPHTERVTYRIGETVRWSWINATDESHPLHLHGHYFKVDGTGDEKLWTGLPKQLQRRVATELLPSGTSVALSWIPERAGNWLFHCHILFHVTPDMRMTPDAPGVTHDEHDASRHMAGLVLGITVTAPNSKIVSATSARRLRLVVGQREGVSLHGDPGLGYQLNGIGTFSAPGPPIILTRGEPVEIAVENRLKQSTSVHWHGIELESYYDGVPGWTGEGRHLTPPIHPGETFVARFTPPRAGTFMYHTHLNDYLQLSTGLYGALIVMEPGQRFDTELDKVFVLSRGGTDDDKDPFLINGESLAVAPLEVQVGKRYRFRFICITPAPGLEVTLADGDHAETWRAIAKDGATLPPAQAVHQTAKFQINPGETYDFEFEPTSPGSLRLTALQRSFKLQAVVLIVVRPR